METIFPQQNGKHRLCVKAEFTSAPDSKRNVWQNKGNSGSSGIDSGQRA